MDLPPAIVARTVAEASSRCQGNTRRGLCVHIVLRLWSHQSPGDSMHTVGIRDLKAHLSRHLKRVRAGTRLLVTERGRSIATIAPVDAPVDHDWAHRFVAGGRALWSGGYQTHKGECGPPAFDRWLRDGRWEHWLPEAGNNVTALPTMSLELQARRRALLMGTDQ